jgi:hypothetical protein
LARFEFEFGTVSFCFSFTFASFGESCLLVSWCARDRCGMACSDEGRDRSRKLDAEERDGHTCRVQGGRAIERSDDVVCGLHHTCRDEERRFLG